MKMMLLYWIMYKWGFSCTLSLFLISYFNLPYHQNESTCLWGWWEPATSIFRNFQLVFRQRLWREGRNPWVAARTWPAKLRLPEESVCKMIIKNMIYFKMLCKLLNTSFKIWWLSTTYCYDPTKICKAVEIFLWIVTKRSQ